MPCPEGGFGAGFVVGFAVVVVVVDTPSISGGSYSPVVGAAVVVVVDVGLGFGVACAGRGGGG